MMVADWLRRYTAHPDPATATTNLVSVVVAANGPFYPLYVLALIGWDRTGAWLTMAASPVFFLVPAVSRWSPRAGRVALVVVGVMNTIWCAWLFGGASGIALFLLPCIVLAALVYEAGWAGLAVLGLATGAMIVMTMYPFRGAMVLSADDAAALTRLNAISVATLSGFVAMRLMVVMRGRSVDCTGYRKD